VQDITTRIKLKWKTPSDPTQFELHYPPARSPRNVLHWDRWAKAMMMDTRLLGAERSILMAIALHYNLETGLCCPTQERVAVEAGLGYGDTASKAAQRAVAKAVELGWLKRTFRHGGRPGHSQSNLYDLTLPKSIQDVLANRGPALTVTGGPGAWYVVQATDGVAICGPFKGKTKANPEWWIKNYGPISVEGTNEHPRADKIGGVEGTLAPPITENLGT
jgi:hypothetical protein